MIEHPTEHILSRSSSTRGLLRAGLRAVTHLLPAAVLVTLLALALPAAAQDELPAPEPVTITAPADELPLVGYFYPAPESESPAPAVLLMHMMNGRKTDWEPLVPLLHEAGLAVLAIDLRGHGETGGRRDWSLARDDLRAWIDWLRARDDLDPGAISLGGASVGAMLALAGTAADADVVAAFALSPLITLDSLQMEQAINAIGARPVLLVAGHLDPQSADAVRQLTPLAEGDLLTRLYPTHTHGTRMFREPRASDLPSLIVDWLVFEHGQS